jgi:hypothetical protein
VTDGTPLKSMLMDMIVRLILKRENNGFKETGKGIYT